MSRNPEQYPGLRRIELSPVGSRINVLRSALQVARQYEKINPEAEVKKPQPRRAFYKTPVETQPAHPETTHTQPGHLAEARSQVNQALREAA